MRYILWASYPWSNESHPVGYLVNWQLQLLLGSNRVASVQPDIFSAPTDAFLQKHGNDEYTFFRRFVVPGSTILTDISADQLTTPSKQQNCKYERRAFHK